MNSGLRLPKLSTLDCRLSTLFYHPTLPEAPTTRVLIADDEEPARAILKEMLGRMPGVEIVGEASNGLEAVRAAAEFADAVFLDIQMPRLDGFEVLGLLDPAIAVVFVTAYDQYAVKAFEVRAVDYVLKPFHEARLAEALARARDSARKKEPPDAPELASNSTWRRRG